MNVERGIRRLVIVLSAFILAVGLFALAMGPGEIAFVALWVGVPFAGLWTTFFALRWVARGFLADPEPSARRRSATSWEITMDWTLVVIFSYLGVVLLVQLGDALRDPAATWPAVVVRFLAAPQVVWLRRTIGDRAAATVGLGFAALAVVGWMLGLVEWWEKRLARR